MAVVPNLSLRTFGEAISGEDRILDGALAAFLDFGIKRTSMGEIARRAGLSPATLYRKFPGKNAVVEAVGIREARRLMTAVDNVVDKTADGGEQVVETVVAFARELYDNQLLLRLLETEPEAILPIMTTRGGPVLALGRAYLATSFRSLQRAGKLPEFDTEQVAEICARLSLSFALTRDGVISISEPATARAFAREHVTALIRLP